MENMAKGCGRSDEIEGVDRMPRIVIPTVESNVLSLTSTTYTSTSYSSTQTFSFAVSSSSLSKTYMPSGCNLFYLDQFVKTTLLQIYSPQTDYCTSSGYTGALSSMSVCA